MAKIDVVITCYNKAHLIDKAIKSVKRQSFTDISCVVVNDGSTDNSEEVIIQAIGNDERFTYVSLENSGVANARNYGFSLGTAPFCCSLDGDDSLKMAFLETCYDGIVDHPEIGIAYTDLMLRYVDPKTGEKKLRKANREPCNHQLQFKGHNQVPCCNVFRRAIFERLGGYRQRFAPMGAGSEDADLWTRFFRLGYKAEKVSDMPDFVYSMFEGITFTKGYKEPNWLNWHSQKPFASLENPENGIAHIVNEYDEPQISVIIPVGPNHSHLLVDALDSVEAQTYNQWEVIVVFDDGSQYNEYYEKAYPYAKFIYTSGKLGAGKARNLGAQIASGKYLVFLDCDDYLQPRFLELTKSALEHFDADWVYTDLFAQVRTDKETLQDKINSGDIKEDYVTICEKDDTLEIMHHYEVKEWDIEQLMHSGIAGVTCLYRKADFDAVGGFEELHNREDWDFHVRLANAGKCGLRLPMPLFTYRQQAGFRRNYNGIEGKQEDIQRIRNLYKSEDLKMACTNCNKNKIELQPVSNSELITLEHIGRIRSSGMVFKGVSGRRYALDNGRLTNVHPTDALDFIKKGLFKAVGKPPNQKTIVAPTTKPTQVKQVAPAERLKQINEWAMKQSQKARRIAEEETERMLKPRKPKVKKPEKETVFPDLCVENPGDYSLRELKEKTSDSADFETMRENEVMGKARKTVISWIDGKLK